MTLLLFDIDGTLISTGGAGMRAMSRAIRDVCTLVDGLSRVPVAGRTDSIILREVLAASELAMDERLMARVRDAYCGFLAEELSKTGGSGVLPGVRPLLDELAARGDTALALLTGNFARSAEIKLSHYDLWRYFAWGVFGDEAFERNDLFPLALERYATHAGGPIAPNAVLVVGDTPHDVACAHAGGARAIGVATGHYDRHALEAAGADVVFDDLRDTDGFLTLVGAGRSAEDAEDTEDHGTRG